MGDVPLRMPLARASGLTGANQRGRHNWRGRFSTADDSPPVIPLTNPIAKSWVGARAHGMISIRIQQLTKRFGAVTALQHLDLTIEPGELFFLLGPSGCGKTTLLRSLAGFYVPEEGRIFFGDEDVTRLAPHKRNTGMMFQSYALWPHMTVAQNVAFGLEERKVPKPEIKRRVHEALESVRMGPYAERRPNQLSGARAGDPPPLSAAR
jgi:ABC-type proline/glycine betaine transport system ATPase subunit